MSKPTYTYDFYLRGFRQAKETSTNLIGDMDEQLFKTRPAEDKWCAGEILSHLVETGNEYLPQINKAFNQPEQQLPKGSGPFTHNFFLQWFIGQVSPENTRPLPTVRSFEPQEISGLTKDQVLSGFNVLQDEFIRILEEAQSKNVDIGRLKTRNPVIKIVPMSISSCFALAEAHQRRHFGQIRNIKEKFA